MNTNSNTYTVVYTATVVILVAAILAFVSQKLGPAQRDNAKAETLRQMMAAAKVAGTEELYAKNNGQVLQLYADNIEEAFTVNLEGVRTGDLRTDKGNIELMDGLKAADKAVKAGDCKNLPVYRFKGGISVIPVYGAGLWGPVWGYIAFEPDGQTIKGAYFDHESETPGLGAKIKDESWFREKFSGKKVYPDNEPAFNLSKNAEAAGGDNSVDAITGATMTSKGLNSALNVWFKAYSGYLAAVRNAAQAEVESTTEEE